MPNLPPKTPSPNQAGLADRRFPFVAETPEEEELVRQEADRALIGVNDMLYKIVRNRAMSDMTEEDVDDIVQECMISLYRRSLPKFDTTKQTKLSTFLHKCASNFIIQAIRQMSRNRHKARHVGGELQMHLEIAAANPINNPHDSAVDYRIDAMVETIVTHPEQFLTSCQVKVFKAWMGQPNATVADLAKQLGYQRTGSMTNMLRRIRQRIETIAEDESLAG